MRIRTLLMMTIAALTVPAQPAHAERVKDIASVAGVRSNQLVGYGLVVGLDGTGDQTSQAPFTIQSIKNMLAQFGVTVPPDSNPQLKNVAAVTVQAELPPFAKPGQTIDVSVSSIGNAGSLRGGTLLLAPLRGADGEVYAMAQGSLFQTITDLLGGKVTIQRPLPSNPILGKGSSELFKLSSRTNEFYNLGSSKLGIRNASQILERVGGTRCLKVGGKRHKQGCQEVAGGRVLVTAKIGQAWQKECQMSCLKDSLFTFDKMCQSGLVLLRQEQWRDIGPFIAIKVSRPQVDNVLSQVHKCLLRIRCPQEGIPER